MKDPSSRADHFVFADVMRTLAISLVVCNHLMFFAHPVLAHRMLRFGYIGLWGVNCFFILSGFLLSRAYLSALIENAPLPATRAFYTRRFLRIYPLYGFCVLVSALVVFWYLGRWPGYLDLVAHFFMLQGLSTSLVLSLNQPLWTMGIDACFYFLLPLGAIALQSLIARYSRERRIGLIASSLVVVSLACVAFRYIAYATHPAAFYDFPTGAVFVRNIAGFGCSFAIGIGVTLALMLNVRIGRSGAVALILAAVCLAIVEFALRFDAGGPYNVSTLCRLAILDPMAALSSAAILYGAANLRSSRLVRTASAGPIVFAGALSYAVYLFHWLAIEFVNKTLVHGAQGNRAFLELSAGTIIVLLPVAYVAHRFVEKPFLAIKARQGSSAVPVPQSVN